MHKQNSITIKLFESWFELLKKKLNELYSTELNSQGKTGQMWKI